MAEDKPMTVRERMAALARASAGGSSAPTPAPPKTVGPSTGLSVAERLAKMRGGQGGAASSPGESPHAKKPGPVRSFEPPTSAPTIVTQGQAGGRGPSRSGGGSSIAAKIAALSGGVKSSILPPSPSGAPTCSSATTPVLVKDVSEGGGNEAAVSPRMSAGLAGRVEAMERTASTSSDVSGEQKDAAAAVAAGASTPRPTPGTISPGLASRMKSMNLGSDATGDGGKATAHSAGGTNALSAPPASESSISSPAVTTKMSPGLAARMGKAVPIPMPGGAMPVGGLAELKLRNQENSRTQGAEAETVDEQKPAETEVEHKPGEMTHANLSRAAIPQGRRPRKTVRPFKVPAPLEATEISGEGGDGAPSKSPGATGLTEIGERNSAAEAPPTRNAAASSSVEDGTGGEGATVVAVEAAQPTALLEDNGPTSRKESMSEAASSGVDEDEIGDDDGWAAEEAEPTASGEQAAAEASSMRATAVLPSVENATEDKGATAAAAEAAQPTALGKNKDFSTKMESMLEAASLGVDEDKDGEEDEWAAEEANVTALGEQDNADEASTTAAAATVPSEEDATSDNSATGATTEAAEPMAPGEKAAEELPTTSAAAVPSAGDATKDEDATSPAAEGAEWTVLGGQGNAAEASPTTATAASPSGENTPEDNDASDSNDAGGGDDTAGDKDATAAEAKAPDPNAHGKQDKPAEASPATAAAPSAENATEDKDAAEDKDAPGAAAEMAEPAAPGVRDDAADAWPRIAADAAPTPPTPAPSKTASSISAGISVAERLAKLRAGLGGAAPSPSSSTTRAKMPGHVRRFTPPTSAPTIFTQSPAGDLGPSRSGGGSSIAAKIAALSGSVKSSVLPPSPSGAPTGSSATTPVLVKDVSEGRGNEQMPDDPSKAAVSSRVSVGWAGRVEAMERTASTSSDASGEQKDTAAAVAAGASTPRPTPGTISPGLAARLKVMNRGSDATGDGGKATADSVDGTEALRTRPVLATKMSPGLAARMGKAIPIHLPGGAMPTGGLAELKRRKQEKERAQGAGADAAEEQKPAETEVEQKPGELKHANLARATISQRRRPRKAVRRFKMNASVEARETVGGAGGAGGGEPPPVIAETKPPSLVDRPVVAPIATNQDAESANASSAEPVVASLATAAAMPSAEDATEGKGTTAVSAQEADRTVLGENGDPASRMKSLLEAASLGVAGDEDGDEDEWTE